MQTHFIKFILIVLSMTPSLKLYANIGKFTANLYCKKSGAMAGIIRSWNDPVDFHWEDIPPAVLKCDVFDDTLDVDRAMSDILKWPGTKITQAHLNTNFKDRMPFIKVEATSGGALAKCTDGKWPNRSTISYRGFKPETINKFPVNDKTVDFKKELVPLSYLRNAELTCLMQGSDVDLQYIAPSDPIYNKEATQKIAPIKENLKKGLSKFLPNSIGSKN
jgi:hypothetical protein